VCETAIVIASDVCLAAIDEGAVVLCVNVGFLATDCCVVADVNVVAANERRHACGRLDGV
jgi:hypothetical protein